MTEDTRDRPSLQTVAAELGVADGLLFQRVSAHLWAHLGGIGRGRGWAGIVDVETGTEPLARTVPALAGELRRFTYPHPERIMGPYYAVDAVIIRVTPDVVVVLGNSSSPLSPAATPDALGRLAGQLDTLVADVGPAKRLADELEVLHAVRAVTTGAGADLVATLHHVLGVAVQALSCEVGFLRVGDHRVGSSCWPGVSVDDPRLGAVLEVVRGYAGSGLWCAQDTEGVVPAPLSRAQGVRSLLAVQLPVPVDSVLVVAHTDASPRGFSTQCQRLAGQLADAAGVVVHTALLREELQAAATQHAEAARRDTLTGLGNRLVFDEALAAAEDHVEGGGSFGVLVLDVDGLKAVNDSCGHAAGDELLRSCATVLREHTEPEEVCVRLGGDEFAVLTPHTGATLHARMSTLAELLGGITSCQGAVVASIGVATAHPGGSVADAVRDADAAMYAAKRARRATRPSSAP